MRAPVRWLIASIILTLFGLLSLNYSTVLLINQHSKLFADDPENFSNHSLNNVSVALFNDLSIDQPKSIKLFAATKFFNMPVTNQRFLGNCSVKEKCRIIDTDIHTADAVLYHGPDFRGKSVNVQDGQVAVVWFLESPISYSPSSKFNDRINWTMTYRRDSDIPLPYGIFKKVAKPVQIDLEQIWEEKNASTVWLVSNCAYRNGRLLLADALKKYGLQVDIFGRCGKPTSNNCDGVKKQSDDCVTELFRSYKFALSFENSLCRDYITEKFYEVLEKRYAVPIVMQRQRYLDVGAPNNSFIAVDDFHNLKDLVDYLREVEDDKDKYLSYHLWRKQYIVKSEYFSIEETGFCALCKKLMSNNYQPKSYRNVADWHRDGACEQPQDAFVKKYLN